MNKRPSITRRDLLAGTAAATAGLMASKTFAFAQGQERIKVGVIGCGGRGTGAALDSSAADDSVVIHAMGDLFPDRLEGSRNSLKNNLKERYQVTDDRAFSGFDAYKHVIATDCDIVILATPPGYRPLHLDEAVRKGKHVFMEKPVAVDGPGIRSVIESGKLAKQKGLAIVAGTQRRHDVAYVECMNRIHDGQMGDVVACYAYWNQGGLWAVKRESNMSDVEWQLRNWLYFAWISGDHIVEQHIHNIDVCNWAMNAHPVKATSLAGREVRTDPLYGHIFDHFATEYEYENGVKMLSMCRQIDGTSSRVSEHIVGSRGSSNANTNIKAYRPWRFEGDRPNPYMLEHRNLINSIRNHRVLNEAEQVAHSTLTAIMGRMSAYTGKEITWEQAMNSDHKLIDSLPASFGSMEVADVAIPGKTNVG